MKPTGPTNPWMKQLVEEIRSQGISEKNKFKLKLAKLLSRSERKTNPVNIGKLQRVCKENEKIVVPGKVLSTGEISKPLTVYAKSFSEPAKNKIEKAGGKTAGITELIKENPKGTGVRIVM